MQAEPESCPKCGARLGVEATACPACGLATARMAAYADARDAAVPDAVRDAWTRATAAWNDAARHDELLRLVTTYNTYAWAAGRYRTRSRDAVAQRQLARLRRAAEATLFASATVRRAPARRPYHATVGVLATLIAVVAVSFWYAMVVRDQRVPASGRPIPVRLLTPGHPVSPSTIK